MYGVPRGCDPGRRGDGGRAERSRGAPGRGGDLEPGELDLADGLFAADYVNHDGLIPDLVRGPEAIKVSVALYRTAFPDLHITIEELTTDGEMVVLHWTARRAPCGELTSSISTRTQGGMTGMTRSRVAGGKIVESWTYLDQGSVLEQLGLLSHRGAGE